MFGFPGDSIVSVVPGIGFSTSIAVSSIICTSVPSILRLVADTTLVVGIVEI